MSYLNPKTKEIENLFLSPKELLEQLNSDKKESPLEKLARLLGLTKNDGRTN